MCFLQINLEINLEFNQNAKRATEYLQTEQNKLDTMPSMDGDC